MEELLRQEENIKKEIVRLHKTRIKLRRDVNFLASTLFYLDFIQKYRLLGLSILSFSVAGVIYFNNFM